MPGYAGHTHELYAYQLKRWFAWCEVNGLDPLVGIQRAHVDLYIRQLGVGGLMDSTVTTMMHGVRGSSASHTLRGHRVLPLVGKGNKPATNATDIAVLRVLEACRGERAVGPLILRH